MRDDIDKNEFKILCGWCELMDTTHCIGGDCQYCSVYNNRKTGLYHTEMEMIVPKAIIVKMGVEYIVNRCDTVAKFSSIDDAMKIFFKCVFNKIRYSPSEMYDLYPNFFKVKSYLSLGVPQILLGNGIKSPLIVDFGNGIIYAIAPVKKNVSVQKTLV